MPVTVNLNLGLAIRYLWLVQYEHGAISVIRKRGTYETRSTFEEGGWRR